MAACAVLALAPPPAQAAAVAAGVLLGLQAELGTLSAAAGHQLKSCETFRRFRLSSLLVGMLKRFC